MTFVSRVTSSQLHCGGGGIRVRQNKIIFFAPRCEKYEKAKASIDRKLNLDDNISNFRSFNYQYGPVLMEDEPTFNSDKIEFIDCFNLNDSGESSLKPYCVPLDIRISRDISGSTSKQQNTISELAKHQDTTADTSNCPDTDADISNSIFFSHETLPEMCTSNSQNTIPPTRSSSFPFQDSIKDNPMSISSYYSPLALPSTPENPPLHKLHDSKPNPSCHMMNNQENNLLQEDLGCNFSQHSEDKALKGPSQGY